MGLIRSTVGLALIFLAWFNPLNFVLPVRIALFILGFDATDIIIKLLLFIINFFYPLLGNEGSFLVWTLLFLMGGEVLVSKLGILHSLLSAIKPLVIFITVFFGMGNFQLALIIAGIDLILNLKR